MKSASRIIVPLILVIIFGKFIPLILAALIPAALVIIVNTAIKEGKFL